MAAPGAACALAGLATGLAPGALAPVTEAGGAAGAAGAHAAIPRASATANSGIVIRSMKSSLVSASIAFERV